MSSQPTIILCPGAHHTARHVEPCVPFFRKAGYRVIPAPILSAGQDGDFDDTVEDCKATIIQEIDSNDRGVILILHSAAGLVGAEAVNRLSSTQRKQMVRIIYVAAPFRWDELIQHIISNNMVKLDRETHRATAANAHEHFFNDLPKEQAMEFVQALTWQGAMSPVLSGEGWKSVRRTFVVCDLDQAVKMEWQERDAEEMGMDIVRMKTGHVPFVSRPEEFVEVVRGILEE